MEPASTTRARAWGVRLAMLSLLLLPACRRGFKPPGPGEPRAFVEIQRVYERPKSFEYAESKELVTVDDRKLISRDGLAPADLLRTAVHPGRHRFGFRASYFHFERQMVSESYQDPQIKYVTESYQCGFNPPLTCQRTVSKTEYVTRYRNVMRSVAVADDECETSLAMNNEEDVIYVLRLHYRPGESCQVTCSVRSRDGSEAPCSGPARSPESSR